MFRTICGVHTADLMDLGIKFRDVHNDPFAALLCLDHAFAQGLKLQAANCFDTVSRRIWFDISGPAGVWARCRCAVSPTADADPGHLSRDLGVERRLSVVSNPASSVRMFVQ